MGKIYAFQNSWLKRKDNFGRPFSACFQKINDTEVLCIICDKKIVCVTKGLAALTQHVATSLHTENAAVKLNKSQLLLKKPQNVTCFKDDKVEVPTAKTSLALYYCKEETVKAELIWTLKTVQCNMATSASDDLKEVFPAMFSGVPENFCLGRTKLSYLITEALGPYFRKELLSDLKNSFYSLIYDETTNHADKKELQFMIRFWSEAEKEVVCKHLHTVFLNHATAEDIVREIKLVLNSCNISSNKLLMLSSDGPNVNKKVWRIMNNFVIEESSRSLINIGTCNLHVVNNTFLKGLQEYGDTACELAMDIFHFFKKFPSRWADYESVQVKTNVKQHRFLKHVTSRWLTAGPACERLLQQWPAVTEYFLKYIPANNKGLMKTEKYKRIVKSIKFIDIKVEMNFVVENSKLFTKFSEIFQHSEPLIHILYSQLKLILSTIKGRICKSDTMLDSEISTENLLKASEVEIGGSSAAEANLLSEKDRLTVLYKIQRNYMESHNYLLKKISHEQDRLLECCQCLQPKEISHSRSVKHIGELARSFSFVGFDVAAIKDEWRQLQREVTVPSTDARIDHFWRDIFCQKNAFGSLKYPSLAQLVKAVLCLSHGNADIERDFSISKRILAEDKSNMSERILNDRLLIKDYLKKYKSVAHVPITAELLKLAYNARKSYDLYLEEQRQLKDQQEKEKRKMEEKVEKEKLEQKEILTIKETIQKLECKVKTVALEKKETQESLDTLLKEASDRLKSAIQKNDLSGIRVAQVMLESVEKLRQQEKDHESKEIKLNKIVHKRKSNIIESFITKKPKCT